MVMGDTVVFQDEVDAAMDGRVRQRSRSVRPATTTSFFDEPKVYFMHIGGMGEPEKLATGVKAVWDAIKKVRADNPKPATRFAGDAPKVGTVTAEPIEKALGSKSESQAGVVKVTIGREGMMHGVKVAGSMGLTTWAGVQRHRRVRGRGRRLHHDRRGGAAGAARLAKGRRSTSSRCTTTWSASARVLLHALLGQGQGRRLAKGLKTALDAQKATGAGKH